MVQNKKRNGSLQKSTLTPKGFIWWRWKSQLSSLKGEFLWMQFLLWSTHNFPFHLGILHKVCNKLVQEQHQTGRFHQPVELVTWSLHDLSLCVLLGLIHFQITFFTSTIGPSGVRALPLGVAAERSVHCFRDYLSFFCATYFSPRRGVLGLWNCTRSFNSRKK